MGAKYAILVAGEPDDSVCKSKGTFEEMFLDLLREQGPQDQEEEEWQLYFAFRGQLPTEEELRQFRGVVITGSVADAFSNEEWVVKLRQTVRQAVERQQRVLGVCFGHQLLGCVLGARVGRAGCWEVGARQVMVDPAARQQLEAAGSGWAALLPDQICLHEFHQDQVLEVPPGATLLASSERCPIEMFSVGTHVLGIQGHPEFDQEVVTMLAEPRLAAIGDADVARMRQTLASLPVAEHSAQLQRVCRAFLKGSA